jgi:hypothetical protein
LFTRRRKPFSDGCNRYAWTKARAFLSSPAGLGLYNEKDDLEKGGMAAERVDLWKTNCRFRR